MKLRLGGARARIYLIAAGVIVLALALFLSAPDFLHQVENRLYDLHFKLRGQQDVGDRVVIVAIDESSLAALAPGRADPGALHRGCAGDRIRYPVQRAGGER